MSRNLLLVAAVTFAAGAQAQIAAVPGSAQTSPMLVSAVAVPIAQPAAEPAAQPAAEPAAQPLASPAAADFSSSTAGVAATPDSAAADTGSLPDAPSTVVADGAPSTFADPQRASVSPMNNATGRAVMAPRYTKYIDADQRAYGPLHARDKIIIGAEDLYSVGNIGAIVASSFYEQWTDGAPNYGHPNSFAKRLGAAAIRETSEGVFTDMVLSPVLHTDPRYFQRGPQHNVVDRTFYAISRVFVTRTDSGGRTVNAALIGGYAGATALQAAYYPKINRNFKDSASEFAGSIGGAALGNFLTEFAPDILHAVHLDKLHY